MSKRSTKASSKRLLEFAKVWNDFKSYPAMYDLERALNTNNRTIQQRARRYRQYRRDHPELGLEELIWRKSVTGGMIAVPEEVIRQLDPFRVSHRSLKKAKGIIVTAAQFGAPLNRWFWSSLNHCADYYGYPLVVMPIKYGPVKTKHQAGLRRLTSLFPDELHGRVLFEDIQVHKGALNLNTTRMRPTLSRFLTDEVCELGGQISQIFAAPKLELEHRPRIGHSLPKAIMTTGAVTYPNYSVDNLGQQDRTGELAVAQHTFAAVLIEFGRKGFHFRQLLSNKKGEFYDIDYRDGGSMYFSPKGVEHRPEDVESLILGDWHTGKTCSKVKTATFGPKQRANGKNMVAKLQPKHVVLHDFVDCDSASHWEKQQAARRGFKAPLRWDSLEEELQAAVDELEWMRSRTGAKLHIVASNHNEYVTEYIETMQWTRDDANLDIGARLYSVMVADLKRRQPQKVHAKPIDPVVWWFREHTPFVEAHERQDPLIFPKRSGKRGILCSMHGDKGVRGGRTRSTKEFRAINQRVFLGHNHSATIQGPVWRVGTSTPRMQHYVGAPETNWTNTHGLVFKNGQRMLINVVEGEWHG